MRRRLIALAFLLGTIGCGSKEELRPLYQPEPVVLQENFVIDIPTQAGVTVIRPNFIQRVAGELFGWIPVIGELIKLPVNLASALIPVLRDVSHPDLPKDSRLNDPAVLEKLASVKIQRGHLRIVPENQRGPDYKPDQCWFRKCPEIGFKFLQELRVYLVFEREPGSDRVAVLIGSAARDKDYDERIQVLRFKMTETDLKPFFVSYPRYRAEVVALGKLPSRDVYLTGGFMVQAAFHLK